MKAMKDDSKAKSAHTYEILSLFPYVDSDSCIVTPFINEEDDSRYSVFHVMSPSGDFVLKPAKEYEKEVYETFFRGGRPYAPKLYGSAEKDGTAWLLMEYVQGDDLRCCERESLIKVLDALISMQDEYWEKAEYYSAAYSLEKSLPGREKRGRYLGSSVFEKIYSEYMDEYRRLHLTLCHDDLLPFNVIAGNERAVLIDWEYAGMLPYPTSLARLIAHGREEKDAVFHITQEDRSFAIDYYYNGLVQKHGIPYEDYRHTVDLFLFYEYCEWIMVANENKEYNEDYYQYSLKLAHDMAQKLNL